MHPIRALMLMTTVCCPLFAAAPDHPIITEVYTDPNGANDGPVGRNPQNLHQEFIEVYLPACAELNPAFNCDALNLTLYEVEGDSSSSGLGLINYRIDLPTFDVDASNGLTGLPRPANGVVVVGWVDYNEGVSDLFGEPDSRVALINGGVTQTTGFTFVAMNGDFGTGTTNFPTPGVNGISSIDEGEGEASSGIVQNGSGAYLLVNRDDPGYVQLFDDEHVPEGESADPDLPGGGVLDPEAMFDGYAGNDDPDFAVEDQPLQQCQQDPADCVDLQTVLPEGGDFSDLLAQIPETDISRITPGQGNGYARRFVDVSKTTEQDALDDDPVTDALNAYRRVRNGGPFFASPGQAASTTSPAELSLALDTEQFCEVLSQTTGGPGLLGANVGGSYGIDISASPGPSSDPAVATFAAGLPDLDVTGQTLGFPGLTITPGSSAADGESATSIVTVTATNTSAGDPPVVNPVQMRTVTATVLDPVMGQDAAGQPLQATVFLAVQPVLADDLIANEFLNTDLAAFLDAQPDIGAIETLGNGELLLDPLTDLSDPETILPLVEEMPAQGEECVTWINPPGAPGTLGLVQTVLQSAEVQSGATTYDDNLAINIDCGLGNESRVKAIALNHPDAIVFGGLFSPMELVNFADDEGITGNPRSGLSNAGTSRTFELVIFDTNVGFGDSLETAFTDDFGLIVEVEQTELDAPVVDGEFVFLSFSGGLQGADIDMILQPAGQIVANLIYLDLDNLHDVLGIRSIEQIYVVDGSGSGELDVLEVFALPAGVAPCPADIDGDGSVDVADLLVLLAGWGNCGDCASCPGDVDEDCDVDVADLLQLIASWGPCTG